MALGTFSSRILGFVRDALMLALFDRGATDAFVVAFRLPNMFRRILGEGALSASFVPLFVEARRLDRDRGRFLAGGVYTVVLCVAALVSTLGFFFMPQIIDFLVDDPRGFGAIPGKIEQTVHLAQIMAFYLILVTTYAFFTSMANTLGYFFWPAVGPTLFNLGLIIAMVLPQRWFSVEGESLAWGVMGGGVLQLATVLYILIRSGELPKLGWRWTKSVRRVFLHTAPGLVGLGVFQLMTIVNTMFAARLGEGAQSFIYAADRILELPQSMVAVSLGAALLPRYSELEASGNRVGFLKETEGSIQALLHLMVPASLGMWFLAEPITQVLFMRGQFSGANAAATAEVVQVYAALLLSTSLSRILAPAFYALKNTWLPAAVAVAVLLVHIGIGHYLVDALGLKGLAMATALSSALNLLLLLVFFHILIGQIPYTNLFKYLVRHLPGFIVVALLCGWGYPFILSKMNLWTSESVARGLTLGIVVFSCGYFYILGPYFRRKRRLKQRAKL